MGMFDYVAVKLPCKNCGEMLEDFQSKSASCNLELISIEEVTNFYTKCENCNTWNEYNRPYVNKKPEVAGLEEVEELGFKYDESNLRNK